MFYIQTLLTTLTTPDAGILIWVGMISCVIVDDKYRYMTWLKDNTLTNASSFPYDSVSSFLRSVITPRQGRCFAFVLTPNQGKSNKPWSVGLGWNIDLLPGSSASTSQHSAWDPIYIKTLLGRTHWCQLHRRGRFHIHNMRNQLKAFLVW